MLKLIHAIVCQAQSKQANQTQTGGIQSAPSVQQFLPEESIAERIRKRRASGGNSSLPGMSRLKKAVILPIEAAHQQQMPPPKRMYNQPTVSLTRDILEKLLPPCSATLSAMSLYEVSEYYITFINR